MNSGQKIRLIGVPSDTNSSFMKGPAKGPAAIRNIMSSGMSNFAAETGEEIGTAIDFDDGGDVNIEGSDRDDLAIQAAVSQCYDDDRVPIIIGGDHAITYPIIKAVADRYGPVEILHIDAHPDLYDDYLGNRRSHASPFARIMEDGLAKRLVQVGIRTLNTHQREQAERFGVEIVSMRNFSPAAVPIMGAPLYISIDLDGLDPSCAPGVSHHEPGGLTTRQLLDILSNLTVSPIGADVVELNPDRDINGMTAALALKLVKELAARACTNSLANNVRAEV